MWNSKALFVENKTLKLLKKYLLTYSYGHISMHVQIEITLWFILPLNYVNNATNLNYRTSYNNV